MEVHVNIQLHGYVLIIRFLSVCKSLTLEKPFILYINFPHSLQRGLEFLSSNRSYIRELPGENF